MHMKIVVLSLASLALAAQAEIPDFFGDRLVSDGIGFVDTGYMYVYHENDGVKTRTSKVEMSFYTLNYGHGEAPGPVTESSTRTIFGYNDSWLRYDGTGRWAQLAHATSIPSFQAPAVSNNQFILDYEGGKLTWGSVELVAPAKTADATRSYYAFAMNHSTVAYRCPGVLELETLSFYERVGDAAETEVRRFRPCYKDGHPALYDEITQTIAYPTTDGFLLSGVDMTVAENARIVVNSNIVNLRTLSLASGAEFVFDKPVTLSPEGEVALPESGVVTVSLPQQHGRGRYVLIDNLPMDFTLDRFAVGQLPPACTGTLSKEGASLVLTIASDGRAWPEALAEKLSSDGAGYVDLGYCYHMSSFPKTARIVCDFIGSNWGKGIAPGPTIPETATFRTVFGYQESYNQWVSVAWYNGGKGRIEYNGGCQADWNGNGVNMVEIDYLKETATWSSNGGADLLKFSDVIAPSADTQLPYYLFANDHVGSVQYPAIMTFANLRVYETSDGVSETLAHDYVPCVNGGKYGVYDRIGYGIYPVQDDTNCFSAAGAAWRLSANGEVRFVTGTQEVTAADGTADGWLLVRDRDNAILVRGDGAATAFTMPEAGVTVVWAHDIAVETGATRQIAGAEYAADLSLGDGATLAFAPGGSLSLSGSLVLPASGTVGISHSGVDAAGVYDLIRGVDDSVTPGTFVVTSLPEGLVGAVERRGGTLVLRVSGISATNAALPDKLLAKLTGDGCAYVDTGYRYHVSSYPKTARVVCDFYDPSWGKGKAPGPTMGDGLPRTVFGYLDSSSAYRSAARWSGSKFQFIHADSGQADYCGRYDCTAEIDYLKATASLAYSEPPPKTLKFSNVTAPDADAEHTYYLFAANDNWGNSYNAIFDFKELRFYETSDGETETLVRDFLPAMKDGRPCVYDMLTKAICPVQGDTNGCVLTGASWPVSLYPTMISQSFTHASSASYRPVSVPDFAPETSYTFVADGVLTLKETASATVSVYDAKGGLVSSTVRTGLRRGDEIEVIVGTAAQAVVALSDLVPSGETWTMHYEIADVSGCGEVLFRKPRRNACEFMIQADATLTFSVDVQEVWCDAYDVAGVLQSETRISGPIAAGGALPASVGTAAYCVLRVRLPPPGLLMLLK